MLLNCVWYCNQFIDTSQTPACSTVKHNMGWIILYEILLFTKFVSLSVIPQNKKVLYPQEMKQNQISETHSTHFRQKRNIYLDDSEEYEDEENTVSWEPICPTIRDRVPLAPQVDSQGNRIFKVINPRTSSNNVDYTYFVWTQECARSRVMVGHTMVRCEQQHLEQELLVYDEITGEELYKRPFFLKSGCEAQQIR